MHFMIQGHNINDAQELKNSSCPVKVRFIKSLIFKF